ncbi:NAD(P)H-binding protein [Nocardia sp. NBC_01503]|uniref:SDR family oxidoreductase n=1 Tax=Nocardia sp. NBC_01503 TaxID=2975997 RepID=UPI002E7C4545|nr:NAD(P)H-binding protein [Nocardia sp. NBC_01503]WTL31458.1 NAD(P)H-binding protein [Nocardia sp. NBC_01503]
MKYLVIGGTGRTGRRAVDLLRDLGHEVVVGTRRPRDNHSVAVDLASPLDPRLLDGIDGVIVSVEPPVNDAAADAVMNVGIGRLAELAAAAKIPVVLVSQIYITRAAEHPDMAGIIRARGAGEQALRDSGTPYAIVRPSWLTDAPPTGVLFEQGDRGDGRVSRATVARTAVAALLHPESHSRTFELYDGPTPADWPTAFTALTAD